MLLLTDQVWVSPGQWGSVASFAFLMACVGGLVVNRAARARRDLRVHRVLLRADVRPVDLPGRAARDSAPPARKRRAAAVHLLHDFRSEDDARLASGTRVVRRTRRLRRVVRAVPAVQDERAAVVAGGVVARRAADRPAAAGLAVTPGRHRGSRLPADSSNFHVRSAALQADLLSAAEAGHHCTSKGADV